MSKRVSFTLLGIVSTLAIFAIAHRADALDGAALYGQYCAGCHGPLATSSKLSRSATQIQDAINNLGIMSSLKSLTSAQVQAIAAALAPPPPPPPPAGDTTPPNITVFSIPPTSSSLKVPIQALTATDNVGVTGYRITESSTAPGASASGWSTSLPSTYTFTSEGTKTLYAWAKDAAGNVSNGASAQVTITLSNPPPPPPGTVDLTIWSGQWLKVTMKYQGYSFGNSNSGGSSDAPAMGQDHENIEAYLKFTTWDPQQSVLQAELYQLDSSSGQWVHDPLSLHFAGGTSNDFLCWTQANGDSTAGFAARIQGREKSGLLNSATFKTLGGYYFENNEGTSSSSSGSLAGGLSMSGSLVPESKVPVPK